MEVAGLSIVQGYGAGNFAQDVHAEAGTLGVLKAGILDWTRGPPAEVPTSSPVGQRPADSGKATPELQFSP